MLRLLYLRIGDEGEGEVVPSSVRAEGVGLRHGARDGEAVGVGRVWLEIRHSCLVGVVSWLRRLCRDSLRHRKAIGELAVRGLCIAHLARRLALRVPGEISLGLVSADVHNHARKIYVFYNARGVKLNAELIVTHEIGVLIGRVILYVELLAVLGEIEHSDEAAASPRFVGLGRVDKHLGDEVAVNTHTLFFVNRVLRRVAVKHHNDILVPA